MHLPRLEDRLLQALEDFFVTEASPLKRALHSLPLGLDRVRSHGRRQPQRRLGLHFEA